MTKDQKQNEEIEIVEEGEGDADKLKKLKEEIKECRKKAEEYLTGWQRAKADLINSRKDEEKKREDFAKYAGEKILHDLLSILDSLDKAILEGGGEGFMRVKNQLTGVMKSYGAEEIEADGGKFNPAEHESVAEEETDSPEKDQAVLETLQKGYKIYDKVLRPARVKVGNYKTKN